MHDEVTLTLGIESPRAGPTFESAVALSGCRAIFRSP